MRQLAALATTGNVVGFPRVFHGVTQPGVILLARRSSSGERVMWTPFGSFDLDDPGPITIPGPSNVAQDSARVNVVNVTDLIVFCGCISTTIHPDDRRVVHERIVKRNRTHDVFRVCDVVSDTTGSVAKSEPSIDDTFWFTMRRAGTIVPDVAAGDENRRADADQSGVIVVTSHFGHPAGFRVQRQVKESP